MAAVCVINDSDDGQNEMKGNNETSKRAEWLLNRMNCDGLFDQSSCSSGGGKNVDDCIEASSAGDSVALCTGDEHGTSADDSECNCGSECENHRNGTCCRRPHREQVELQINAETGKLICEPEKSAFGARLFALLKREARDLGNEIVCTADEVVDKLAQAMFGGMKHNQTAFAFATTRTGGCGCGGYGRNGGYGKSGGYGCSGGYGKSGGYGRT